MSKGKGNMLNLGFRGEVEGTRKGRVFVVDLAGGDIHDQSLWDYLFPIKAE
jgi:hypothetical protein